MKKTYLSPAITFVPYFVDAICQVGSVQGNSDLQFGGEASGEDPAYIPM